MQNIISVLEELKKFGEFLVLEKIQRKYYLYSNNDSNLKYAESWQTENVNLDAVYKQHLKNKVDISSLILEFNKYLNQFILKVSNLKQVLKIFMKKLIVIQEQSQTQIQETNSQQIKQIQLPQAEKIDAEESFDSQTEEQYPLQEFQNINQLQNIIDNYQNLIIQLILGEENQQIQFKNPICINYQQFKKIQLEKLFLNLNTNCVLNDYSEEYLTIQDNKFENELLWFINQENLVFSVNQLHLSINIYHQFGCDTCEYYCRGDAMRSLILSPIKSNYLFLYLKSGMEDNYLVNLYIEFQQNLDFKEKCKIIVNNEMNNDEYYRILNVQLDAIEIPSILDNKKCYIRINEYAEQNIQELMLEDQYILMLSYLIKNQSYQNLFNLSLILSDLLLI
ncbi:hypothetical protein ABPG74_001984 [Tetrahymena malaccensis]